MRLLETSDGRTYQLTANYGKNDPLPAYTILSHTWEEHQEVIFDDLLKNSRSTHRKLRKALRLRPQFGKRGYDKLDFCARRTKCDGLRYFWVDTCCIDKNSSEELHLSINSMFQWYKNATKCYVYLSDVSTRSSKANHASLPWQLAFAESRWFTRGWTLQELLAPPVVEFYSREGRYLGNRLELKQQIHEITDIPTLALSGASLDLFSVDEKLSWAVDRQTKREEDEVYALLGIFDIKLPFIYDEGYDKALRRLLDNIEASRGTQLEPDYEEEGLIKNTLPFRRDADFIARDHLDLAYRACKTSGGCAALIGLGGTGKSQIAVECCYRIIDHSASTRVFWVHAETRERLKEGYLQIAKKTNLDGWDDPKTDIVQLVHAWLRNEANGRWLLVLDSADDMDVFLNQSSSYDETIQVDSAALTSTTFLPRTSTGSILITTRNHEVARMLVGAECSTIEVGPMNNQDAFALLKAKFKAHIKKSEADALITALDHMPLALTQAAAFIQRTPRMSISRYLEEIGHDPAPLLRRGYLVDTRRDTKASNSIMTTWQISFDYIRKRSSAAARLLSLMSMFDRQGIPKSLLVHKYTERDHGPADFDHDIYMLISFCLVKTTSNEDTFEMHGLVQQAMRKWLEHQNELEAWKEIYVALIDENYPVGEYENWTICQTLLPHALAALGVLPKDADALEAWASLSLNVGWYLGNMGDHKKAHKLLLDSFDVREILLGPEDPETLDSLNSLGLILKRLGRLEEARTRLEKAWEIKERTLGPGSTATLTTKVNLASVLSDQTQWSKAEKLLMEALQTLRETGKSQTHAIALTSTNLLATLYRVQDRWKDATRLNSQLLEARSEQLGPDAPLTLIAKCDLAFTYRKQGQLSLAESMQLEIIESCIAHSGAEIDLLGYKAHLAQTYRAQNRLDEAEALETQVLERSKEKLGHDHLHTMMRMSHLASTYWEAGKFEQAQALDEETLELRILTLGEDHLSTLDTKANLAATYWTQGLYDKAEALQSDVLAAQTRMLGANHPMTLVSKSSLATTFREQGRLPDAEKMNQEVLDLRTQILGPDHPDTLNSMNCLAITFKRQGRPKEAMELMAKCCEMYNEVVEPGSADLYGFRERFERWNRELKQDHEEG